MAKRVKKQSQQESGNDLLLPLLTIADVMQLLKVSRPTVYTLIREGLPVIKFGRAVRFAPGSIGRFVAQREQIG